MTRTPVLLVVNLTTLTSSEASRTRDRVPSVSHTGTMQVQTKQYTQNTSMSIRTQDKALLLNQTLTEQNEISFQKVKSLNNSSLESIRSILGNVLSDLRTMQQMFRYLCEYFSISKYFTVINEIFLLSLGICEDFSENDKIIPTKSKINTQNGEYICIF